MAAGTQVAASGAERKVEIDEICIDNLDMNNLNNVGDNSNGDGKDKSVDSLYSFVSGGDPGDIGGGVSVGDAAAISGSADEVDRFNKEESGLGNSGIVFDVLALETNAVNNDSITVSDAVVSDNVDIVNRSAVDSFVVMETSVIGQDFNGEAFKSNVELVDTKEVADVEAKTNDVAFAVTFDLESTVNTTETSQVTDHNPESNRNPALNEDCEVMVNSEPESFGSVINETECQSAVDASGKPSEDLEGPVFDWSESSESPIIEREAHVTVDRTGKLSEALDCQKAADGFESSGSTVEEQEQKVQVSVDLSESIGSLVDNQEHPVLVDDSEPVLDNTKEVDPRTIVMESDVKSEEHLELVIKTLEVNVEEEPNRVCSGIKAEHTSHTSDVGETQFSGIDAYESEALLLNTDEEIPEEKQVKENIERSLKFTESEELVGHFEPMMEQVKRENNIQESQTVVTEKLQDDLNLDSNTAESANEADVSPETVVEQKAEPGSDIVTEYRAAEGFDFETRIENVDEEKETEAQDPVRDHRASSYADTVMNPGSVIEFGSFGRHETIPNLVNEVIKVPNVINEDIKPACGDDTDNPEQNVDGSHTDRISDNRTYVEGSVSDAIDVQNEEVRGLVDYHLIKIPRFEDENLREEIRSAQSEVTEKTSVRDAIRVEILEKRDMLRVQHEALKAAYSDENKARRLVKSKRQEIDSVLAVINRWKNAMSVEDFDNKILNLEYMIQHETIQLKDEKQFIREIKRLKSLRDHLASNMGTHEEIRQAIDQKDQNEEHLKILRKELDALKANVSKAEEVVKELQKKYEKELATEREMQNQFRAADGLRQQAYAHLNSLKKLAYDKNQHFRQFKKDLAAARSFLKCGDEDSLQRLCSYQMETFMEQWNNDDEFRKGYVNMCNMNARRRQRALDRESLVHDDASPALPCKVNQKDETSLVPVSVVMKSLLGDLDGEHEEVVSLTENKIVEDSEGSIENVSDKKNQTMNFKGRGKSSLRSDVATVAELAVVSEAMEDKKEEDDAMTKEEIELAGKAEEIKKEEIEAKLKEQRRLEEKAKAMEALERKKRNTEKAQIRAEMWARKEAEQKEKEREKRLRKKEKKTGGDRSLKGEDTATSASSSDAAAKELQIVSQEHPKKKAHKPPPHFFSKQLKPRPVPPPHLIRHKKTWQYCLKFGIPTFAFIVIILLVMIGNSDYNLKFNVPRQRHV